MTSDTICHSSYDFLSGQAKKEQGKRLLAQEKWTLPAVSAYSNVQLPFKRKAFEPGLVMWACDPAIQEANMGGSGYLVSSGPVWVT